MTTLFFIGCGSAGSSLAVCLAEAGYKIEGIVEPNANACQRVSLALPAQLCRTDVTNIPKADIVFLAVPDPLLTQTATTYLPHAASHQIWFHLSGAQPPSILHPLLEKVRGIGTFHPAHVFPPKRISPIQKGTYFGIAGNEAALTAAEAIIHRIDGFAVMIPDSLRPLYHAAATMASNAIMALIATARNLLISEGIEKEAAERLLTRLAKTSIAAAEDLGIDKGLTGPIQRGDEKTILGHLGALAHHPNGEALYRSLGLAIGQLAEKTGQTDKKKLERIQSILK